MSLTRLPIAMILAGLLGGCTSDDLSDLKQYVARVKAREPAPIKALPEIKPVETFVYAAGDRRDPFSAGQDTAAETTRTNSSGISPDLTRHREELEQFPLDSLKMVGTLEQGGNLWALIKSPDGVLHRVKPGDHMGLNYGQITLIDEDHIELTEIVPDGMGGYHERPVKISLVTEG